MTDLDHPTDPSGATASGGPVADESPAGPQIAEGGSATRLARSVSSRGIDTEPGDTGVSYPGLRLAGLIGALVLLGLTNPWMLVVVLALVVMITLHELGHYLTAKRAGMKVTEFFLGFGPKIWSTRRGETEYGVKLIPAGAYVKIIGMHNLEEVPPADEPRTYRQKGFWSRLSVAVAGSTMHFLLAVVLIYVALVFIGQPGGTVNVEAQAKAWYVESVVEGSGADLAGLEAGDRIVEIDGQDIATFEDLAEVVAPRRGETVEVVYVRDGDRERTSATLTPYYSWVIDQVVPGSAVEQAGLEPGDRILTIDGEPTLDASDLDDRLDELAGRTVPVRYERDLEVDTVEMEINSLVLVGQQGYLGIAHGEPEAERLGVVEGLTQAPADFVETMSLSLNALGRFFTPGGISDFVGQVGSARSDRAEVEATTTSQPTASGPAASSSKLQPRQEPGEGENRILSIYGLVQIGSDVGEVNPAALISLFALINIFIGVFNLVPLLPFDGGHVAIAVYERIQERRLHQRRYFTDVARLLPLTYAVVLAMGLLFISSLYLDIANPLVTQ